jgi:serine protease AprX
MDSAHSATKDDGTLAYSVFQQGSGMVNAYDALLSSADNCANQSLNIAKDIDGEEHYSGPSNIDENGDFYIEGLGEEYVWKKEDTLEGNALIWKVNYEADNLIWNNTASTDALIWKVNFETDALIWKVNLESDALIWKVNFETDALIWKVNLDNIDAATIEVNKWVEPQ